MSQPEEQMEQVEQAREAASDPFNRRVTLSIAISAATLATVGMFGQNADNDALLTQGEALMLQSKAAVISNERTNKWGQYQANNIRGHMYAAFADSLFILGDPAKKPEEKIEAWRKKFREYEDKRLPLLEQEARKMQQDYEELMEEARELLEESKAAQKKADRFDFGELGLQLGVVLCSLAILTKNKNFWFVGIACSALGLLFGLSGIFEWFL